MSMKSSSLDSAVNPAQVVILITVPQKAVDQRLGELQEMNTWVQGDWVKQQECGQRVNRARIQTPALGLPWWSSG